MNSLEKIRNKIYTNGKAAERMLNSWRKAGQKIVFTNGCFDIVHLGHVELLSKASDLGSKLIIGLNSDESVKRIKGSDRPLQDEYSRALILASFEFVDLVIFFSEDTPYHLIQNIKPDFLVKGGDYRVEEVIGHEIVTNNNGKVVIIKFVEGYSSSYIVKRIKKE
jgi:D-glycero-beta-D-manno-heptose 1-phosphate adenylyltransferase